MEMHPAVKGLKSCYPYLLSIMKNAKITKYVIREKKNPQGEEQIANRINGRSLESMMTRREKRKRELLQER